jgi:hypothetical protein
MFSASHGTSKWNFTPEGKSIKLVFEKHLSEKGPREGAILLEACAQRQATEDSKTWVWNIFVQGVNKRACSGPLITSKTAEIQLYLNSQGSFCYFLFDRSNFNVTRLSGSGH